MVCLFLHFLWTVDQWFDKIKWSDKMICWFVIDGLIVNRNYRGYYKSYHIDNNNIHWQVVSDYLLVCIIYPTCRWFQTNNVTIKGTIWFVNLVFKIHLSQIRICAANFSYNSNNYLIQKVRQNFWNRIVMDYYCLLMLLVQYIKHFMHFDTE